MTRATNNRLLTEDARKVQKESNYSNFWLLLENDGGANSSKIPAKFVKNVPTHPLGHKTRV